MKPYKRRVWLNDEKHGGIAFVRINADELSIGDCSRIVNLDFAFDKYSTEEDVANVLSKADILFNEVKAYRRYLKREARRWKKEKSS